MEVVEAIAEVGEGPSEECQHVAVSEGAQELYRDALKGGPPECVKMPVNKTKLFHPISPNLGPTFRASLQEELAHALVEPVGLAAQHAERLLGEPAQELLRVHLKKNELNFRK